MNGSCAAYIPNTVAVDNLMDSSSTVTLGSLCTGSIPIGAGHGAKWFGFLRYFLLFLFPFSAVVAHVAALCGVSACE